MNLAEFVDLVMKEKNLSATDVERNSGKMITDGYVAKVTAGEVDNPTLRILLGLAKGLDVDPTEVFKAAANVHQERLKETWTPRSLLKTMEQAIEDEELGEIFQALPKQKPAKIKAVKKLLKLD